MLPDNILFSDQIAEDLIAFLKQKKLNDFIRNHNFLCFILFLSKKQINFDPMVQWNKAHLLQRQVRTPLEANCFCPLFKKLSTLSQD